MVEQLEMGSELGLVRQRVMVERLEMGLAKLRGLELAKQLEQELAKVMEQVLAN